jgi:hypothetical protein
MKLRLCFLLLLPLGASHLFALTIPIDLGSPRVVHPAETGSVLSVQFADSNGTVLNGQNVSFDFVFREARFVHLFSASASEFNFIGYFFLSGSLPSHSLVGNGYAFDAQGKPYVGSFSGAGVGSLNTPDNPVVIAIVDVFESDNNNTRNGLIPPFDVYGVHFDFTLPDAPDVKITNGEFSLNVGFNDAGRVAPFAIGSVPETGSALAMLAIALLALAGSRKLFRVTI